MSDVRNRSEPTNDAEQFVVQEYPYIVSVGLVGTTDMLFHRWSVEAIAEKAAAKKNSLAKKTDAVESYVYRNDDGDICLPGEYLRQSIITAAKFRQDPRSPRKSAMDLYKAGIVTLTTLASLGVKKWDYEDLRRVVVQRQGITRTRPAMRVGWTATIQLSVVTPEYITQDDLADVITNAGRLIGLGDFRPTFGRFRIQSFSVE